MDLLGPFTPKPPKPRTRYSVQRAKTEDERAQLVERVGMVTPTFVAPAPAPEKWRVELTGDHVVLRHGGVTVELPIDEARRIAETILRRG